VDPSRSVNRNVTVPCGNPIAKAPSPRRTLRGPYVIRKGVRVGRPRCPRDRIVPSLTPGHPSRHTEPVRGLRVKEFHAGIIVRTPFKSPIEKPLVEVNRWNSATEY